MLFRSIENSTLNRENAFIHTKPINHSKNISDQTYYLYLNRKKSARRKRLLRNLETEYNNTKEISYNNLLNKKQGDYFNHLVKFNRKRTLQFNNQKKYNIIHKRVTSTRNSTKRIIPSSIKIKGSCSRVNNGKLNELAFYIDDDIIGRDKSNEAKLNIKNNLY